MSKKSAVRSRKLSLAAAEKNEKFRELCQSAAVMLARGQSLEFVNERHRAEYYRQLLAVSHRGTWNEWVTFFAQGVAQEASDAMGRVQELDRLREQYQRRVQTARASALLPKLVDQLFVNPAITTNRAAEVLNVKFNSAQKTIDKLLGAGIIKELTGQKRNRIYLATDILAAIEGKTPAALP
jgi:Fic family protein